MVSYFWFVMVIFLFLSAYDVSAADAVSSDSWSIVFNDQILKVVMLTLIWDLRRFVLGSVDSA